MFKDKKFRLFFFGKNGNGLDSITDKERSTTVMIESAKAGEPHRHFKFRTDDGFIIHLLEQIEKLNERLNEIENAKVTKRRR